MPKYVATNKNVKHVARHEQLGALPFPCGRLSKKLRVATTNVSSYEQAVRITQLLGSLKYKH